MYPTYGTYEVETIMQHRHAEATPAVQPGLPFWANDQRQLKDDNRFDKRMDLIRLKRITHR